jgi:thiosulfate dehydrogenase [quinone] large subunit
MTDIFGILDVAEWLAILRIGIGLWWVKSFAHKPLRRFVNGQMADWTISLAENHPFRPYGRFVKATVEGSRAWLGYVIVGSELAIGLGLVFGFLTPIALIGALLLNFNYLATAGVRPKDISVNRAYQCEQGQNWNMIVGEIVLLATGSWAIWSLDAALGLFV